MKWIYWILAVITVAVALPSASAAIHIQGGGPGFMNFETGRMSVVGNGFNSVSTWSPTHANWYARTSDRQIGVNLQRPTFTQQHRFDNYNQNYRTVEYGDWQVQGINFNDQRSQSAFRYQNSAYGPTASGVIGDYRGSNNVFGFGRTNSYAYSQRYNAYQWSSPWSASSYTQPGSLSSFVTPPRAYY